MNLRVDILIQVPPHLSPGAFPPQTLPLEGPPEKIKEVLVTMIDDAIATGIFDRTGCLSVTIQACRKT